MTKHVEQVGGDHYAAPKQHWDIAEQFDVGYLEGNASKYVLRWRQKGGVQDLKKALSYVDKMLECRPGQGARRLVPEHEVDSMLHYMNTPGGDSAIVKLILCAGGRTSLVMAWDDLTSLIQEEEAK